MGRGPVWKPGHLCVYETAPFVHMDTALPSLFRNGLQYHWALMSPLNLAPVTSFNDAYIVSRVGGWTRTRRPRKKSRTTDETFCEHFSYFRHYGVKLAESPASGSSKSDEGRVSCPINQNRLRACLFRQHNSISRDISRLCRLQPHAVFFITGLPPPQSTHSCQPLSVAIFQL